MAKFEGTVKSYDPQTGKGVIALKCSGEQVYVEQVDWDGTVLSAGLEMTFEMMHRPTGVYAVRDLLHRRAL